MVKKCTKCSESKDVSFFYKSKKGKYGVRGECKACAYNLRNKELRREYTRNYQKTDKWKKYIKGYRERTGNGRLWCKKYRDKNKSNPIFIENVRRQKRKYYYESESFKLLRGTVQYKLKVVIRTRLNSAIKDNIKVGSSISDLGCSVDELKSYLESKFQPGMTWDNWAHDGWHIDHIKPLASFDLSDRKQFLKACNYKNLQPLWAKDNFSKKDKVG